MGTKGVCSKKKKKKENCDTEATEAKLILLDSAGIDSDPLGEKLKTMTQWFDLFRST